MRKSAGSPVLNLKMYGDLTTKISTSGGIQYGKYKARHILSL